jgi:hypothetical protein
MAKRATRKMLVKLDNRTKHDTYYAEEENSQILLLKSKYLVE